jgi:hypothetical protein
VSIAVSRPLPAARPPRTAGAAGALLLAGMLAACGGSGSGQSGQAASSPAAASTGGGGTGNGTGTAARTPGSASSRASTSLSASTCRAQQLTVTVDDTEGGGAAGSTYVPLDFANSSGSACTMYGFPGVSFTTSDGDQIGAAATRNTGFGNVLVTLRPGGSAHAWLQVADAQNYPQGKCDPTTASALRVYPPGTTGTREVRQSFAACRSASTPILTVTSVRSGRGVQGTVP